jgi:hypothetical protein
MEKEKAGKPEPKKEIQLEEIARRRGLVDGRGALLKIPHEELARVRGEFQIVGYYDSQSGILSYVVYGAPKEGARIRVPLQPGVGSASQPESRAQYMADVYSPRRIFDNLFNENKSKGITGDNTGL